MVSVDVDAAGISPAFMVKFGFTGNKISEEKEDFKKITQTKNSVSIHSAVNVTSKNYLTSDMIALEKEVKDDYLRIMKFWKEENPK